MAVVDAGDTWSDLNKTEVGIAVVTPSTKDDSVAVSELWVAAVVAAVVV